MDYLDKRANCAAEVVQSFVTISRAITKCTEQNAASLGLTLPQMGIMNTISATPEITLKEITERLLLSKSTASVAVDDLVTAGLVERKTSTDDRREINLKATFAGKELSRKSGENAFSYRAMVRALAAIPEPDIQLLLRTHQEILAHLNNASSYTVDR